jgi:hypothetical protein
MDEAPSSVMWHALGQFFDGVDEFFLSERETRQGMTFRPNTIFLKDRRSILLLPARSGLPPED